VSIFIILLRLNNDKEDEMRTLFTILSLIVIPFVGFCAETKKAPAAFSMVLDKEKEIEMALTAAPENLRKDAAVYTLGPNGYMKVRDSKNGFHCLVEREGEGTLGPICYDTEGSQTLMLAAFETAKLALSGKSQEEIETQIDADFKSGKLIAPRKTGIAYMLSNQFQEHNHATGETKTVFPPHVMFYAPYMKNSDIGASKEDFGSLSHPWILNEGKPGAYIIVVPKQ
jgi:hypothetical protein